MSSFGSSSLATPELPSSSSPALLFFRPPPPRPYLYFYVLLTSHIHQADKCKVAFPFSPALLASPCPDGHGQHIPNAQPRSHLQRAPNTVTVVGIPSVSIQNNQLVVGDAQTCMSICIISAALTNPIQPRRAPTPQSRSSGTVPSEQYGFAIGMENSLRAPHPRLCSARRVRVLSMQGSAW